METLPFYVVLIAACSAAKLPNGVKVCKLSDPDYNNCVTKSATDAFRLLANGNKDLGLPKIDPMLIKSIAIHTKGSSINLNQHFNNVTVKGLSKFKSLKFVPNFQGKNCELFLRTFAPQLEMEGPYKAEGKILMFALRGHGKGNVKLINPVANFTAKCERREKGGKTYVTLTDVKMDLEIEKAKFDVENLIEGNKPLSDEVLHVVNENSLDFFREVKGDYERPFADIFKRIVNTMFEKIPFEELFPQ